MSLFSFVLPIKADRMGSMQRAAYAFFLVFAFLFVQGGAVAHAVSHVAPVSHAGGEGMPSDTACELCVGYAQLSSGALLSVPPAVPVCAASHEVPVAFTTVSFSRFAFHSSARAPPAFLS